MLDQGFHFQPGRDLVGRELFVGMFRVWFGGAPALHGGPSWSLSTAGDDHMPLSIMAQQRLLELGWKRESLPGTDGPMELGDGATRLSNPPL